MKIPLTISFRALALVLGIAQPWLCLGAAGHHPGPGKPGFVSTLSVSGGTPAVLTQVAPGIYAYKDTCNVYAIVSGSRAILIDFGSGEILSKLPSLGVQSVDWILHTHFHRDQAQGDQLARAHGIKIAVPAAEKKYFDKAEELWNEKAVLNLSDMRNEFFSLRQNVTVDFELEPWSVFRWNGVALNVIPTPGHTEGSLSFLSEREGKKVLFCGDLVASAGKVPTIYDLEWDYTGKRGLEAEIVSLRRIRSASPDLLLPSHGSPSPGPITWEIALQAKLLKLYDVNNWEPRVLEHPTSMQLPNLQPVQLSRHVWQTGVGYMIVADSGHAMFWDTDQRESLYLKQFQKTMGFTSIDFMVPSHYHADHTGGMNDVKKSWGGKLWAMDHLVDILEHPSAYNLPSGWHEPMKVDRVLHDGEKIEWEGIPLQFFYLPGQTEYTEGMLIEIDGKKLLFDGDNVFNRLPGTLFIAHFNCRNYQRIGAGHLYSARKILELQPDYVCPNHTEWLRATPETLQDYLKEAEEVQGIWMEIVDQPDPEIGVDNNWVSFYPYQLEADPGETVHYELRVRNWIDRDSQLKAEIKAPGGWAVNPPSLDLRCPAKGHATAKFEISIPHSETRLNRRFVVTADIWRDGEHLGELTEGLVNMKPMKAH
jgi:glyoxylase-like metal-dependent hydrolase (beta-lactamase superfamily II)